MADYYTEFSAELSNLTLEEEQWLREQLTCIFVIGGVEYTEEELDEKQLDKSNVEWFGCRAWRNNPELDPDDSDGIGFEYAFDFSVEPANRWLWVYSEDYGNLTRLAVLIQAFLRKFRPRQSWGLCWADTCSKLRLDAFGGGAVFITPEYIDWFHTNRWLSERQQIVEDAT